MSVQKQDSGTHQPNLTDVKFLVINADDFGADERTNAAIIRTHTQGVLTTTSLMVNEPSAADAVRLARENPSLGVGLHVVVSNGISALNSPTISPSGRFNDDPAASGFRYFFSRKARVDVQNEVREQFSRFAATGLPWSHVDGHQHLHMHPIVWDSVIKECEAYGILRIRIPYEEWRPFSPGRIAGRRVEWLFFRALRRRCLKSLAGRGFTVMDRVYGHLETGNMTSEYTVQLLSRIEGRTNEVYFHPGTRHAHPLENGNGLDVEEHALLDARVKEQIEKLGLCLTTFAGTEV